MRRLTGAAIPNAFQKEFRETDQRVNLLFNAVEGFTLKIFPIPDDENDKWITTHEHKVNAFMISDSTYSDFIKNGLKAYIYHLNLGKKSGDYKIADDLSRGNYGISEKIWFKCYVIRKQGKCRNSL